MRQLRRQADQRTPEVALAGKANENDQSLPHCRVPSAEVHAVTRIVRFRIVGDDRTADAVIVKVHELDKVDRIEEVADQAHARDDVSSLGLPDDEGPDFHNIEVHVLDAKTAQEVHDRVEIAARELDATIEFVDEF